jgi:hypothetical protein
MTTAAVIDRLVHHCIILKLNLPSYRLEQSQEINLEQSQEIKRKKHEKNFLLPDKPPGAYLALPETSS